MEIKDSHPGRTNRNISEALKFYYIRMMVNHALFKMFTKICIFFNLLISLYSCSGWSQRRLAHLEKDNWVLSNREISYNEYNADGTLGTTAYTTYYYINGQFHDSAKSITIRKYDDRGNLVDEKDFYISTEDERKLNSERIYSFNEKNKKTMEIDRMEYVEMKYFYKYDQYGFNTGLTSIFRDTTISSITNNREGKPIKIVITKQNGDTVNTMYNSYLNGQQIATFGINSSGDTIEKTSYVNEGGYLKRISENMNSGENDTFWKKSDKVYEHISHDPARNSKSRSVYKYDSKGNQIEAVFYK